MGRRGGGWTAGGGDAVERRNAFSVRAAFIFGCRQYEKVMQSNCSVRYFGRFSSEKRAREWIAAHVCLTKQVARK
jgi:hypothetical protein